MSTNILRIVFLSAIRNFSARPNEATPHSRMSSGPTVQCVQNLNRPGDLWEPDFHGRVWGRVFRQSSGCHVAAYLGAAEPLVVKSGDFTDKHG